MQALSLDYLSPPHAKRMTLALLAGAILLASLVGKGYVELLQEKDRWEKEQSRLVREQKRVETSVRATDQAAASAPELSRLAEVKRQFAIPWNGLFTILESVSFDGVALLSMQPESATQSLMLTAEAKDLPSMLEYARRLSKEPMLVNVQLTSHQIQQQDPQKPIRFVVQANWIAK